MVYLDRVGSEFWRQRESFGDDIGGIKMTLTKTEKGEPVVFGMFLPIEWLNANILKCVVCSL